MNKYRIKEYQYLDKEDAKEVMQFFVQEQKSFLGITWWSTLQELYPCGDGCVSSQPKIFREFSEAKEHIKKLQNSHARKSFTRYYYEF